MKAMSSKVAAKVAFDNASGGVTFDDFSEAAETFISENPAGDPYVDEAVLAAYHVGFNDGLNVFRSGLEPLFALFASKTLEEWEALMEAAGWQPKVAAGVKGGMVTRAQARRQVETAAARVTDQAKAAATSKWLDREIDSAKKALKTGKLKTGHVQGAQSQKPTNFAKFTAFRLIDLIRPKFRKTK